jgi:nucleotide-binding universal stress UspA family protein
LRIDDLKLPKLKVASSRLVARSIFRGRIYAEGPSAFRTRFREYWSAWREEEKTNPIAAHSRHVVGTFVPPAAAIVEEAASLEGIRDEISERYQKLVDETTTRLKHAGIKAEGIVREGKVGKTIVEEAKEWEADLIVVGAHGLSGLESLIMGNVARHVVDHAVCSVEVIRPKSELRINSPLG